MGGEEAVGRGGEEGVPDGGAVATHEDGVHDGEGAADAEGEAEEEADQCAPVASHSFYDVTAGRSRLAGCRAVGMGRGLAGAFGAGELARREGFNQDGRRHDGDGGEGKQEVESHVDPIGMRAPDISLGRLCCVVRRGGIARAWVDDVSCALPRFARVQGRRDRPRGAKPD